MLDFKNSVLQLKRIGTDVRLKEGSTGHYLLDLFQFPALLVPEGTENDAPEIFPDGPADDSDTIDDSGAPDPRASFDDFDAAMLDASR